MVSGNGIGDDFSLFHCSLEQTVIAELFQENGRDKIGNAILSSGAILVGE